MSYNRRTENTRTLLRSASLTMYKVLGSIVPTAEELSARTGIPARDIQRLTEENKIWQRKTSSQCQKLTRLKSLSPPLTQKQLADKLKVTERQIRNLEKLL